MNEKEFIALLQSRVEEIGEQKQAAEQWGISCQFLNDLLRGRREPSKKILDAMGFVKVVRYEKA